MIHLRLLSLMEALKVAVAALLELVYCAPSYTEKKSADMAKNGVKG